MAVTGSRKLFAANRRFEWDENKRKSNIPKHGIDFADAIAVFSDPGQFTYRSRQQSNEPRYVSVGMAGELLLAVVSTPRGERLRIISARAARRRERDEYG